MFVNDQQIIQPLLNLFDSIQEILSDSNEIDLPKIVVIGDQSSGKSSVLESIAKINLPRGENTVTRSPISIQMRNSQNVYAEINYQFNEDLIKLWMKKKVITNKKEGKTYESQSKVSAEKIKQLFDQLKQKVVRRLNSFDDIDVELRKATDNILKIENVDITQTQINLKLSSPTLPNLTLIDLPGLNYKSAFFSESVKAMYRKYISNPSTIILVVMPADQDFTNTEANIIAAEKDPGKTRTLGIVTKIDRHQRHFGQKLLNNDLNYKLGIFLVRNRTQQELDEKISYEEVKKREELILQEKELAEFPSSNKGTSALINMLIKLQNTQVMHEKHRVREDIVNKISEIKQKLAELPEPCIEISQKHNIFVSILHQFQQDLEKLYSGDYGTEFTNNNFHLRARIDEMFDEHQEICYSLQKNYLSDAFRKELLLAINERKGIQLYNFLSFQCFSQLFGAQIKQFEEPSKELLRKIFNYLKMLYLLIIEKNFSKFYDLQQMAKHELNIFLLATEEKLQRLIKFQFKKESIIIFTKNPLYLDFLDKIKNYLIKEIEENAQQNKKKNTEQAEYFQIYDVKVKKSDCCKELFKKSVETSQSQFQTTEMQLSLFSYSNTLFKRLMDYIYSEILYQICQFSNLLYDFLYDKFSPISGIHAHESQAWISNSQIIENKRMYFEKSLKLLNAALQKFELFEK